MSSKEIAYLAPTGEILMELSRIHSGRLKDSDWGYGEDTVYFPPRHGSKYDCYGSKSFAIKEGYELLEYSFGDNYELTF